MTNEQFIPLYQLDSFSNEAFKGNPAAVCLIVREYDDALLQKIAAEMNLSETAFIYVDNFKTIRSVDTFRLRWFTPQVEVNLCGHATLAAAAVLFNEYHLIADVIKFETLSGQLLAKKSDKKFQLNFPLTESSICEPDEKMIDALGIHEFENCVYSEISQDLLIQLKNMESVERLSPDFNAMKMIDSSRTIRGVIVTAKGDNHYDFVSRFFAPWVGINEDPVTGSAHTLLQPYWSKLLVKNEMKAKQVSSRSGELIVRATKENRVEIEGDATLVMKGKLLL
ncbi:MAG: PhzF family phenazine biosynthesis protein [Candidatus Heimdallarchaeota archaeon]|nr:PhzF family phenazine biosynthesis protein [Candidatus Heimdallarchaeota archaeon]MCG3257544.1 PhzF family phenazine biosynthesis protein [Candidatus Heimdallarchaeota archaeon]MCK4612596.1 PhzF family phenazine biosynthesis protein [Candidatus Heimdallarchaeota archaeon]